MKFAINLGLFKADSREVSNRIRTLKRALGATWRAPMAAEQRELRRLKLRATELCALRAFARGRLHLRTAPRDRRESRHATRQKPASPAPGYVASSDGRLHLAARLPEKGARERLKGFGSDRSDQVVLEPSYTPAFEPTLEQSA